MDGWMCFAWGRGEGPVCWGWGRQASRFGFRLLAAGSGGWTRGCRPPASRRDGGGRRRACRPVTAAGGRTLVPSEGPWCASPVMHVMRTTRDA